MAKTAGLITSRIAGAKVVGARVRLFVPDKGPFEQRVSVIVDLGQGRKFVNCVLTDHELEKRLLYVIHPRLKRSCLRPPRVREAMNQFMISVRAAAHDALAGASSEGLHDRAKKLVDGREARRRSEEYRRGVDSIRSALMGPAKFMELEELEDLWKQCNVEVVLRS